MAPDLNRDSLFNFVVKEGHGVKGLVDAGIDTVPEFFIQPPNKRIDTKDVVTYEAPVIDLSELDGPKHDEVVTSIVRAAETLGFFQVVNHGVPLEVLESVKDATHRFFELPTEKKALYLKGVSPSPLVNYATSVNPEKEKVLRWKDYVNLIYANDELANAFWPDECKKEVIEFIKTSRNDAKTLMKILMDNLRANVDESRLDALAGLSAIFLNYSPKCPDPDVTIAASCHTDIGMITLLLRDDNGGLYVKLRENIGAVDKDQWIEIPSIPGALTINIGDSFEILSNGRYKSAEHRVRSPSTEARVSVPIFINPLRKEKIGPLHELVKRDGVAHYREFVFEDYASSFFDVNEEKKPLDYARVD